MREVTFRIAKDSWLSANDRHHWARKAERTRGLRLVAYYVARQEGLEGLRLGTTHVTAHIGYPRAGTVDPANANPAVKALIDGMVDAGVWDDDDAAHIIGPDFRLGEPTREKGMHSVRLVLEELSLELDPETDCPNCSRVLHVLDLCECDHELGPMCGPCCRREHRPGDAA
jgi:crossover junction endodeoxyribonuclease RusA